jgi:hypothetical protein
VPALQAIRYGITDSLPILEIPRMVQDFNESGKDNQLLQVTRVQNENHESLQRLK